MIQHKIIQSLGLASLLVLLFLVVPAFGATAPVKDSDQVLQLLSEVKSEAVALEYDTSTMETFTRSNLAWESHSGRVSEIKEHINNVGKTLTRLNDVRATASAWQQQAIDRITPLMKDLADNVTATIQSLDENRHRLHTPDYKEFLVANHEMTTEVVHLVSDYVEYGKAKAKVEKLSQRLQTPSGV
jgi:hypothetical protein